MPQFRQKQSPQEALLKKRGREKSSAGGSGTDQSGRPEIGMGPDRDAGDGRFMGNLRFEAVKNAACPCCKGRKLLPVHHAPEYNSKRKGRRCRRSASGLFYPERNGGKKAGNQAKRRFLMDFPVSASVCRASGSAPAIRAARSRTIFWRMRSTRSRPSWVMATMILRRSLAALMRFR